MCTGQKTSFLQLLLPAGITQAICARPSPCRAMRTEAAGPRREPHCRTRAAWGWWAGREGSGAWGSVRGCGKAREEISREEEPEVWIPLRAQRKISEPFEVCPLLRTSSILKSIPDRRARNCWRISKKKESQPNKKYTPGQYIARSLI